MERDRTFNGTITLTVKGLPAGVTATPEPAVIPPGGGFHVDVKIRLSADKPFVAAPFTVEAGGKVATYGVEPAAPTASLRTSESRLIAPRFLGEGSNVVLDGSGFCDGTKVRVGNDLARGRRDRHDGGRTLRFKTPRLATPGPITILPPHGAAVQDRRPRGGHVPLHPRARLRELRLRRLLLRGGASRRSGPRTCSSGSTCAGR